MSISQDTSDHKADAEKSFCLCVLGGTVDVSTFAWLTPQHFTNKKYGEFWRLVMQNPEAVMNAAETAGCLYELMSAMPNFYVFSRPEEFANMIVEDDYLLGMADLITRAAGMISQRDVSGLGPLLASAAQSVVSHSTDAIMYPDDVERKFMNAVDNCKSIRTGIQKLDDTIGGFFPTELIVMASRPGVGKTAMLLTIARRIAERGQKVLLFSLEMSAVQLWARMACAAAKLDWKDVRAGRINATQKATLVSESEKIRNKLAKNLVIIEDVFRVYEIHRIAINAAPDIVMIDQLPEIDWHENGVSEVLWYGRALRYLRQHIAKAMGVPLVVVHQINRGAEDRPDKRPRPSDLRNSGEVEQRADVILLLHRPDVYTNEMSRTGIVPMEVNVGKNRQGEHNRTIHLDYSLREQWIF